MAMETARQDYQGGIRAMHTQVGRASEIRRQRLEKAVHGRADAGDASDDKDREEHRDQRIFDGGGTALVAEETAYSRSRSIGMSGKSAGGIGYWFKSRGRTHF